MCWYVCRTESLDALIDPMFISMSRDPDQRRKEQWERAAQARAGWGWGKWLGLGGVGSAPLAPAEEDSLHARYLARANAVNLTEAAEMKIMYISYSSELPLHDGVELLQHGVK